MSSRAGPSESQGPPLQRRITRTQTAGNLLLSLKLLPNEIQAAVFALRNTRGLAWPKDYKKKKKDEDILDWLGAMYGFQKHNVANQREHLILLLANVHIRQFPKPDQQPKLDERALTEVMKKLFKNYKKWCKYLGRKSCQQYNKKCSNINYYT
ncbi:hypothetical protein TSUD_207370 [Trifolium subterraneum]|uniref:Uncharacterized protein n=1 Tax=Trifolium subterraneum TaxID=3900 RepID=A0A2Z6MZT3_TRISU|nr:hypothetical protein TSUD_207370 [Trifolium subterraneum]